jgi:hypothetical protein
MSKKPKPPRTKVRVADLPWNSSVEGVLKQSIKLHLEHGYTDVVIIATRRTTSDGVTPIDTLTFTTDRFRIAGIVRWALDRMLAK